MNLIEKGYMAENNRAESCLLQENTVLPNNQINSRSIYDRTSSESVDQGLVDRRSAVTMIQ